MPSATYGDRCRYPNLHLAGRKGKHKYTNQDHAMIAAMFTAKNIRAGRRAFDVWCVNQDAEYHEEGGAGRMLSIAEKPRTPCWRAYGAGVRFRVSPVAVLTRRALRLASSRSSAQYSH